MERSRFGPNLSTRVSFLPTSASSSFQEAMKPSAFRMSATRALSLLYGMVTESWYAELALRRRVSMSATGSVIVMWALALPHNGFRRAVCPEQFGKERGRTFYVARLVFGLEREAKRLQQRAAFVVGLGSGHDGDVHTANAVDGILVDLVEHNLLGQTEGVVAVAIELLAAEA